MKDAAKLPAELARGRQRAELVMQPGRGIFREAKLTPTIGPIERSIPTPKPVLGGGRTVIYRYPWRKMRVGDSILVRGISPGHLRQTARLDAIKHDCKYIVRKTGQGVRVWRVE